MKNGSNHAVKSESSSAAQNQSAATAIAIGKPVPQMAAGNCGISIERKAATDKSKSRRKQLKKTAALYVTIVVVSTCVIFLLEDATIFSALKIALVAAVGKAFAASWVTSFFD